MRVNPYPMPDLLAELNKTELSAQKAMIAISTGRRVNSPSDDPAATALEIQNNDLTSFNAGYLQNLTTINGQFSAADSALGSVVTSLQRAISLGVQGATSLLSDADRAALAQELTGIQSQIISLANTSYQGNYIFGGTATGAAPYVANSTDPSGVTYNGNDVVNQVAIGSGYQIDVNQPGSKIFSASSNNVFLALNNLIVAVQTNTNVDTAISSLSSAAGYLSAQRVFYGNAMNQAASQTTYLNNAKLQLAQQQNSLVGVDLATAATNLSSAQADTQATLAAISKFSQMNLFDYLR
jgi:flagellar hook-associated protein 3 FlgL